MTSTSIGGPEGELRRLSARLRMAAEDAALEAGILMRGAFETGVAAAESKADFHDLVTEHDRLAEERIRDCLSGAVPGGSFLGEEGGLVEGEDVDWYVDPIDGTNNFAAGVPFFCVSIAAVAAGRLVAGVVYDPVRSELFAADLAGARCNGATLVSTGAGDEGSALLCTDFPSHRPSEFAGGGRSDAERFEQFVGSFRTVRRLGSCALALAYVAAGRADVAFGTSAQPWDVAAGLLLVEQAGGRYRVRAEAGGEARSAWEAPTYVAHVDSFDLDGSCLGELFGPARA